MIMIIRYAAMLGGLIHAARRAADIPQRQIAGRAGVAQSQVSKYERSGVVPDTDTAIKLLDAMGWQMCALPRLHAQTYVQREAVVTAARRLATDRGWCQGDPMPPYLDEAVDALTDAERQAGDDGEVSAPRSPGAMISELLAEINWLKQAVADRDALLRSVRRRLDDGLSRLAGGAS